MKKAFLNGIELPLNRCSRYVIFGDCHRGTGNAGDNFLKNKYIYQAALEQYFSSGFCYLEPGDGEELWENRCLASVLECHSEVYKTIHCMKEEGLYYKIYGNHDMELKTGLPESILLKNQEGGNDMYVIHGHQADFLNSVCWKFSRALVRYLWKPLELFGVNDPTSTAKNNKKKSCYEQCMIRTATREQVYIIAGHSHRPYLEEGNFYVNAGSCIHPGNITAIEIEQMQLALVKWFVGSRKDGALYVERKLLKQVAIK